MLRPPAPPPKSKLRRRPNHATAREVAGLSISHPDKILDDASHLTKLQLVEYYDAVADHLLPHIAGRPLSIVRCPEGSGKPCFFQKQIGKGMPAGVDSVPVTVKKGGNPQREEYVTVSKREGLVGLGQMGVMELHPWGSSNKTLEQPDRIIIDLDPDPELPWKRLVESAIEVRDLMKHLGLETFVKSTGGKGIHVVAPIEPEREWSEIKEFAHHFVLMMEARQLQAVPDEDDEVRAHRPHLPRLPAQRTRSYRCRAVFTARSRRRACGHAAHLGRTGAHRSKAICRCEFR